MSAPMIRIGDRVERPDNLLWQGRVTGFAPNGWVRVRLDNGQQRIWPKEKLDRVFPEVLYSRIQIAIDALQCIGVKPTDAACEQCGSPLGFACMGLPWGRFHAARVSDVWRAHV
jgi:hypothetical protein